LVGGAGWFVSSANSGKAESESDATTSAQDTIRVQISTLPPDAELLLDGKPISNPFDGEFERDEARHELVASREGFEKTKKKLVLTAAQRIFIPMTALGPRKAEPEEKPEMVEAKPQPPKIAFPRPTATKAPPPAPVAAPVAAPPPAPAPAPTVTPAPAANPRDLKKIF
jgi:hypothetical protein